MEQTTSSDESQKEVQTGGQENQQGSVDVKEAGHQPKEKKADLFEPGTDG